MKEYVDFSRNHTVYFNGHITWFEDVNTHSATYLLFAYPSININPLEKHCLAMGDNREELLIWADMHNIHMMDKETQYREKLTIYKS